MPSRRSLITALVLLTAGIAAAADPDRAAETVRGIPELLVSRQLRELRGLEVGEVVRVSPNPDGSGARPFRIAGSYEPVPNPFILTERRLEARLHLPDLIALRNREGDPLVAETVTQVNVALGATADPERVAGMVARSLPGLVVRPAVKSDGNGDPFIVLERFHLAIAIVTVIGSSAFLLALMVMRSDERRETAGVLRLIGLDRRRILFAGFVEGLLIATTGALFGVLVALSIQGMFNRFFQWYYDTSLVFVQITPGIIARCIALAVPLGVLAGLVASWTLLRRNVLALIRR